MGPASRARKRIPAITGAEPVVLIVVASGDDPWRSTCLPATLVSETGALLLVTKHRTQQRVDVNKHLILSTRQQLGALHQPHQMSSQHRCQLEGVAVGELPQELPHRGRGTHLAEHPPHPT